MSKLNEYIENMANNWFCTEVFTNIESRSDSKWGMCCRSEPLPYDVYNTSLLNHYNSDIMKRARTEMLSDSPLDQKPTVLEYCRSCIVNESAGLRSLRLDRAKMVESLFSQSDILEEGLANSIESALNNEGFVDINSAGLYLIEIKSYGNLCNLKCRMCWDRDSSSIAAEMKKHGEVSEVTGKPIKNTTYNIFEKTNKKSFFEDLKILLPRAFSVKFTGGEPFMMPSILEVIKFVVDNDYSKNLQLNMITNGTTINPEIIEYTKHFKTNRILFSIEGIEELDEYIRSGTNFFEKMKNIDYIRKNVPRLTTSINTVVQALNIGYIDDLYLFGLKHEFVMHQIFISRPNYLRVQVLPRKLKDMYLKKLSPMFGWKPRNAIIQFDPYNSAELALKDDFSFTEEQRSLEFEKFKEFILRKDKQRNESVFDVLPEFREYF